MKQALKYQLVLFLGSLLPLLSWGQPANNTCETATDISSSIGGSVCGDNSGATNDGDDGDVTSCADWDTEVWYSFTGVSSISLQITSWCGTTYEPTISLYSGSCGGGLNELGCDDYNDDNLGEIQATLDSTETYYISVQTYDAECTGSFCFDISTADTGDCITSSQAISECGTSFTLDNSTMGACGRECGINCGGGVTNYSNYDGDCTTECGICASTGRDGCDMDGSTENNAWWGFIPTETCEYEVTMDVYDCDNESACFMCSHGVDTCCGIQYGIYGYQSGSITDYYAHDGSASASPVTITETFQADSGKPVKIMIDGYGGDACKVDVSVAPVNCSGCTLPIEMLQFGGKPTEEGNELNWLTATEAGNSHFLVQRSENGRSFETFERVEGAGHSTDVESYKAFDPKPFPELTYYRLKQFDMNGDSRISNVIAVQTRADVLKIEGIHPSPTGQGRVDMDLIAPNSGEVGITIYDQHGKIVARSQKAVEEGNNRLGLPIQELSEGFYMVRVEDENGSSAVGRFVKTSK